MEEAPRRLTAAPLLALALSGCAHTVGTVATVPSPDGRHVAYAYTEAGGGPLAYCYLCVDVAASAASGNPVSAAPCRGNPQRVRCQQVEVKWWGVREVWVRFAGKPRAGAPLRQPARSAPDVEVVLYPDKARER